MLPGVTVFVDIVMASFAIGCTSSFFVVVVAAAVEVRFEALFTKLS